MFRKVFLFLLILYSGGTAFSQTYSGISFYVVPHEEDWQLFMGNAAWNDIRTFHERGYPFTVNPANPQDGTGVFPNGLKVVMINITAGNFSPGYLNEGCYSECDGAYPLKERTASTYWEANEAAENKSISLAANRPAKSPAASGADQDDGWGNYVGTPGTPKDSAVMINGHDIAVHIYKNVVAYYLRLDEPSLISGTGMYTVDHSATYANYTDLVKTVQGIYDFEISREVAKDTLVQINTFDPDNRSNPGDHALHYYTGQVALEAATTSIHCPRIDFGINLYQGFSAGNLAENLGTDDSEPQVQRKAGLYSAYCLGMLKYNALLDSGTFGPDLHYGNDFLDKEYSRAVSVQGRTLCPKIIPYGLDSGNKKAAGHINASNIKMFPNPASDMVSLQFSDAYPPVIDVKIIDINSKILFQQQNLTVNQANTVDINIAGFKDGTYELFIDDGTNPIFNQMFIVYHAH